MKKNSGFSIIELMVVIAIIGILATIAVPNFQKFQAKAKQSNAKVELTGLYTAEQAFFTEFGQYHANLPYIGYAPDGVIQDAAGCTTGGAAAGVQRTYNTGFGADGTGVAAAATVVAARPLPTGCATAIAWVINYPNANVATAPAAALLATSLANPATFVAQSSGVIRGGGRDDIWTINESKSLQNTQSGY